jgi:two-component system NtrC family sensor kinase
MSRLMQPLRSGLALKLAVYLVVSTGFIFLVFGVWNIRMHRSHAEALLQQDADSLNDIILRSTRYHMLRNDRDAIARIVADIGSEPGISRIRIADRNGIIRYSNQRREIGTMARRASRPAASFTEISRTASGERELAVERPIYNQPNCAGAVCHDRPETQKVLGAINTHLSLASVDRELKAQQDQLLQFTLLALALISLASVVFVFLVVHRRVKELKTGTRRVAGGDLSYRLPSSSRDELGQLAESFNAMTIELEKARRELIERTQNSLIQSEKMASLGKLAATVAHELNNPLFGVLTYARLANKQVRASDLGPEDRERLCEKLSVIERESRRSGEIVRNLLAFARQAPHKVASNSLNLIVERAMAVVRHRLELQGVTTERKLDVSMPDIVCDEGQLQQVMLVLLVNAAEAMPSGGWLIVATGMRDSEQVYVSVRDTGGGIAPEVMPHIFEPFFTTKADTNGSGLGLAIAHGIVSQHGGDITVNSTPGKGTEFMIVLPARGRPDAGEAEPARRPAIVRDVAEAKEVST